MKIEIERSQVEECVRNIRAAISRLWSPWEWLEAEEIEAFQALAVSAGILEEAFRLAAPNSPARTGEGPTPEEDGSPPANGESPSPAQTCPLKPWFGHDGTIYPKSLKK